MKKHPDDVYSILVTIGGADERDRQDFVIEHLDQESRCNEWRFMGTLGRGGKYWRKSNRVDCYAEDKNPIRNATIDQINVLLAKLPDLPVEHGETNGVEL